MLVNNAGLIKEVATLQNAGDFNSYICNVSGSFASGFERSSFVTKSVRISDKSIHVKLQSITKGLKYLGYLGNAMGITISFLQMRDKGYSNQALVRFGVDGTITIIGFINPNGLPIGYTAALILGAMNSEGAFDSFYNQFDKTPKFHRH